MAPDQEGGSTRGASGGLFFEFGHRLRAAGLNENSAGGVAPCARPPGGTPADSSTDAPTANILSKLE